MCSFWPPMIGRYCGAAAAVTISDSAANCERGNNTTGNLTSSIDRKECAWVNAKISIKY